VTQGPATPPGLRLPAYDELPRATRGGRSAWGLFGADDCAGLLNLQTPERVAAAARLVRAGEVYSLNAPVSVPESLWAERGIAGRGVLIDIDALLGGAGHGFDPASPRPVTAAELDAARAAAGVEWQPGDVLLLHTGFLGWQLRQPPARRAAMAGRGALASIGLAADEEMARYLWDAHVAAVVADNPSVEVWPSHGSEGAFPFGFLHRVLVGQFGMALGELWWLADLASACRRDGRYEVFLTAAPLSVTGGVGSPANALAFK
jgi:kynurenine formamidase